MAKADVDIDRLVDYKSEYWAYIKKPHLSGDEITGLCPFHDDHNSSFSVDLRTGKWHCHSENIGGNYVQFYAKIHGVDTKQAYKEILERYGVEQDPKAEARKKKSYSLSQYAFEKHLPEDWLASECHLSTAKEKDGTTYLRIPYYNAAGEESTFRKRFAQKDFKWRYGSSGKICLYGEWKLPQIRQAGYAILVEGESDSQSLWHMGISALGIPGASMFKPHQSDLLQDLKIYIHQEADQGGRTFLQKITDGLKEGGFIGTVYKFSCGTIAGCKDPSDVLMKFGREKGAEKIMDLIGKAERLDLSKAEVIPPAIQDAPVNLRMPAGWEYSDDGISKVNRSDVPTLVCRTPIILTKRLRSLDTGEEKIEIAFKRDRHWQNAIFTRSTIFTARGITSLTDLGCTVTSENAKTLVRFLSALEAENIDVISRADATSTFGWQPGNRFIPGHDNGIVLDVDPAQRNMALAYSTSGSMDEWIQIMAAHRIRDKFRFILAASFAAPLLRIVKQRIFVVYNWGGSKGGKTAALKAALSAWGDPDRLMVNFNATQVGLERTAAFYCDLPLGIDERQLAGKNQESLEKTIYMLSSGTGKIRGAKSGGIQAMSTWRTVALATGEEPLSTETSQTGVSTRTLEIYGGPFDDEQTASIMHQKSAEVYGWAGPAFIDQIIAVPEEEIREAFNQMRDFVQTLSQGKAGSHVAGVSVVALADALIDTWFFSKSDRDMHFNAKNREKMSQSGQKVSQKLEISSASWKRAQVMAQKILEDQMSAEMGDVNENAVQCVLDWVTANQAYFGDRAIGTCLGMMSEGGEYAYIFPSLLSQKLTQEGYSSRKTLKYMAEQGLITTSEHSGGTGRSYQVTRRFRNRLCKFVEFHIGALSETKDPLDVDDDIPEAQPARAPQEQYRQGSIFDNGFHKVEDEDGLPFA